MKCFDLLLEFDHHYFQGLVADILRQVFSGIRPNRVVGLAVSILRVPSGNVNLVWPSVTNTATEAGCSCITDFSCGPYLARSTRTWSLLMTTL